MEKTISKKKAIIIIGIVLVILIVAFIIMRKYVRNKPQTPSTGSAGAPRQDAQVLMVPIEGPLTSPFGPRTAPVAGASTFHNGIDIGAPLNADIVAPLDGVVKKIYNAGMGGKQLLIQHGNWVTGYADLNGYASIAEGDHVSQGQVIAYAGKSGPSTGAHLHFTLTDPSGNKVDPMKYFGSPLPGTILT